MDPDPSTLIMSARPPHGRADGGWTLAARYRIDSVIGRGGMSTVYRATDLTLDRQVAVKVLLPSLAEGDPTHIARFEREARAVAALRHPAVVRIYDTGRDGDTHFIVMEHVSGRGLNVLLRDGRPIDPLEATRIAAQVADALARAHAAGILHRDIKPANVMIGPRGEVKILDFGIARAQHDPTLTQPAFAVGTAAYMSPERVLGRSGDERSDIYSLGCLLYAMLTGRPPFLGDDVLAVLHQQVHAAPVPPRRLTPQLAPPLDELVLRMLAKDPAARPQTAAEVSGRLADRGHPTAPGAVKVFGPGRHRRPLAWSLLLAGVLALVVVLAAGGGASRRSPGAGGLAPAAVRAQASADRGAGLQAARVVADFAQSLPSAPVTGPGEPQQPASKPVPPGHGGVPPGHAAGGPPGHDKPPKPPNGPKGQGQQGEGGD
jgi:serine/threonine-protein kinase